MKVALNGFGRIGRNFLRAVLADQKSMQKIEIVAINIGPASIDSVAHMTKYDSLMGTYKGTVTVENGFLYIDSRKIALYAETSPEKLPWKELGIEWVVEATGHFTQRAQAERHLQAGADAVLISAPAHDEDCTIIPGVNDAVFDRSRHRVVSLGSCTTNAMAVMLKILHDSFGIQQGWMTTIHAYTNTQVLLDVEDSDLRRSRAAALNIIPTTTGAAKVIYRVVPELEGRIQACAVRVPVAKVSLIDLAFVTEKAVTVDVLNSCFERATKDVELSSVVGITKEPLVSSDFAGDGRSVIVDALLTTASGNGGKVFGWYDNEWGYSCRLRDFLVAVK